MFLLPDLYLKDVLCALYLFIFTPVMIIIISYKQNPLLLNQPLISFRSQLLPPFNTWIILFPSNLPPNFISNDHNLNIIHGLHCYYEDSISSYITVLENDSRNYLDQLLIFFILVFTYHISISVICSDS